MSIKITLEMIYEKLSAIENKLDKIETAKHNIEKISPVTGPSYHL